MAPGNGTNPASIRFGAVAMMLVELLFIRGERVGSVQTNTELRESVFLPTDPSDPRFSSVIRRAFESPTECRAWVIAAVNR